MIILRTTENIPREKMIVHSNDFLLPNHMQSDRLYHLIIVNSQCLPVSLIQSVWSKCTLKICADGGGNRLFDGLKIDERSRFVPNTIIGDLDSLRTDVCEYYSSQGVEIIQDLNQDNNDLDKSFEYLKSLIESYPERYGELSRNEVLIFGGLNGARFDQEMANLNSVYTWNDCFQRIILVDDDKTTFLLKADEKHVIRPIRNETIREGRYCGLIPLSCPARSITTTGLQWNLSDEPLEFGKRISSSNSIPNEIDEVTIISSDPIIWTATWTNNNDL